MIKTTPFEMVFIIREIMKQKRISVAVTVFAMVLLILDSRHGTAFASEGIDLCIRTVIPSLFPFFLLSIYLAGNLHSGSGLGTVWIPGFLGGYPTGAQAAAELRRSGRATPGESSQMLYYCSQAGPAFLFGMVGPQFDDIACVWKLWAVQLLSAVSVYSIIPQRKMTSPKPHVKHRITLTAAMQRSLRSMAAVCGWIVIFRVILGFLSAFFPGGIGNVLLSGLLELSNGCLMLRIIPDPDIRFLLAAVMLNFGGICVMIQTASVTEGLDFRCYVRGKLLQTAVCIPMSLLLLGHAWALIPVCLIILLPSMRKRAKRGSNPAPVGV